METPLPVILPIIMVAALIAALVAVKLFIAPAIVAYAGWLGVLLTIAALLAIGRRLED